MTISSGFFAVLIRILVSKWICAVGRTQGKDLHRRQPGRSPDVAENAAESFLGHLVGFAGICLKNMGRTVREMWSVGVRESEVTGFYIGRGKASTPGSL